MFVCLCVCMCTRTQTQPEFIRILTYFHGYQDACAFTNQVKTILIQINKFKKTLHILCGFVVTNFVDIDDLH